MKLKMQKKSKLLLVSVTIELPKTERAISMPSVISRSSRAKLNANERLRVSEFNLQPCI